MTTKITEEELKKDKEGIDKYNKALTIDSKAHKGNVVLLFSEPISMLQLSPNQVDKIIKGLKQRRREAVQQRRNIIRK